MKSNTFRFCRVGLMFLFALTSVYAQRASLASDNPVKTRDAISKRYEPYEKQEHWAFYVQFDKRKPYGGSPKGCARPQIPQGVYGGLVQCAIEVPEEIKGYISHIEYSCHEGDDGSAGVVCGYVHECPAGGTCQSHNYAYEPHDFQLSKPRKVDWFGWTNDGNSALLRFDVFIRDEE